MTGDSKERARIDVQSQTLSDSVKQSSTALSPLAMPAVMPLRTTAVAVTALNESATEQGQGGETSRSDADGQEALLDQALHASETFVR